MSATETTTDGQTPEKATSRGFELLPDTEYSASRRFFVSSAVWFCVGTLWGLLSAMALVAPDLFAGIPWLEFGRIRPAHTNTVIFGFVVSSLLGGILYAVPALLRTKLHAQRAANAAMWLWNLGVIGVVTTLPLGLTQAREYAEPIFPVKLCFFAAMVLLIYVMTVTVLNRKENLLYVTVWYGLTGIFMTLLLYPVGNVMWHPFTGAATGIVDAIWLWWYGHNIFGLMITLLAIGMAYYIVPRIARKPLYSHTLSLVGFWSIVVIYTHIGTHHLIQAPVPTWLKVVAIVDSGAMVIPVVTAMVNIWLTMRGAMRRFADNIPGQFIFAGTIWYLIVSLQGSMQSFPSVQRYTHFNNWVVGHAHVGVLGFGGFIALGTLWYILPLITKRRIYSRRLLQLQFWLVLLGIIGFTIVLTTAGLIQGQAWVNGQTEYRVLSQIVPYMSARAAVGVLIIASAFVGLYNVLMTIYRREPTEV